MVHIAKLCDQVATFATAHDCCSIFDIVTELEQSVRGLASHISRCLSTLAQAFAMMLKLGVNQRT